MKGLGGLLGVPPTAKDILNKVEADPASATLVSAHDAETQRQMLDLGKQQLAGTYAQWQRDSQADDWILRNWRPILALMFALQTFVLTMAFCWLLFTGKLDLIRELSNIGLALAGLVGIYFTGIFGILGVYIKQRSNENIAQIRADSTNTPIDDVIDVVKAIVKKK